MITDSDDILFDGEDRNEVLNSLSDEILIDNLVNQINKLDIRDYVNEDYLDVFNIRFNYLFNKYQNEENFITELRKIKNEIYFKVITEICNKFKINFIKTQDELIDEDYFSIMYIYRFFVLYSYENIINFFINYIHYNKEDLIKQNSSNNNTKDLSYINIKKVYKNIGNTTIIYNFEDIINTIASTIEDDEFVLETIISEDIDNFLYIKIKNLFLEGNDTFSLQPEYSDEFFKPITDNYEMITEIKFKYLNLLIKNLIGSY